MLSIPFFPIEDFVHRPAPESLQIQSYVSKAENLETLNEGLTEFHSPGQKTERKFNTGRCSWLGRSWENR